jgi:nicotinate phosphoribosyltransferase
MEDIQMKNKMNLTMLTDFYELTMANGYFETGMADNVAYFDMFFRRVPDGGGYAIMAGVEQLIDYFKNLKFTDEDIEFLRSKNMFCEEFLNYLRDFKFECDVWSVPEGTPIFPHEPIITVRGPVMQAQFVETMILLTVNHQSLIATKANRIVRAAKGRSVMEFGTRRAHGGDAAIYGARAAYIGGCAGTACAIADRDYGIKALGTMAHSWVQMYPDEYSAFKKYAEIYPDNCVLLVDTYNVLKSGVPAAIKVFKEMKPAKMGIRIDSGDVAYLTKKARAMLDEAGLEDCSIVVSNSLDEYIIRDVILEGACIDSFGVGERLITAKSEPVFGGVYKLVALEAGGELIPKIKISENVEKITNPGFKHLYRLYDKSTGKARGDVITIADEIIPEVDEYEIFDPNAVWKRTKIRNYFVKDLRVQIFDKGNCVYESPSVDEIKEYCKEQVDTLWAETLRFENPQTYYVDLSQKLWDMKNDLLESHAGK